MADAPTLRDALLFVCAFCGLAGFVSGVMILTASEFSGIGIAPNYREGLIAAVSGLAVFGLALWGLLS